MRTLRSSILRAWAMARHMSSGSLRVTLASGPVQDDLPKPLNFGIHG